MKVTPGIVHYAVLHAAPCDAALLAAYNTSTTIVHKLQQGSATVRSFIKPSICLLRALHCCHQAGQHLSCFSIMATPHLEHVSKAHATAGHLMPPVPEGQGVDCTGHAVGNAEGDAGRDG